MHKNIVTLYHAELGTIIALRYWGEKIDDLLNKLYQHEFFHIKLRKERDGTYILGPGTPFMKPIDEHLRKALILHKQLYLSIPNTYMKPESRTFSSPYKIIITYGKGEEQIIIPTTIYIKLRNQYKGRIYLWGRKVTCKMYTGRVFLYDKYLGVIKPIEINNIIVPNEQHVNVGQVNRFSVLLLISGSKQYVFTLNFEPSNFIFSAIYIIGIEKSETYRINRNELSLWRIEANAKDYIRLSRKFLRSYPLAKHLLETPDIVQGLQKYNIHAVNELVNEMLKKLYLIPPALMLCYIKFKIRGLDINTIIDLLKSGKFDLSKALEVFHTTDKFYQFAQAINLLLQSKKYQQEWIRRRKKILNKRFIVL